MDICSSSGKTELPNRSLILTLNFFFILFWGLQSCVVGGLFTGPDWHSSRCCTWSFFHLRGVWTQHNVSHMQIRLIKRCNLINDRYCLLHIFVNTHLYKCRRRRLVVLWCWRCHTPRGTLYICASVIYASPRLLGLCRLQMCRGHRRPAPFFLLQMCYNTFPQTAWMSEKNQNAEEKGICTSSEWMIHANTNHHHRLESNNQAIGPRVTLFGRKWLSIPARTANSCVRRYLLR